MAKKKITEADYNKARNDTHKARISTVRYNAALKIILDYENQKFAKNYKEGEFPCIICDKKIKALYPEHGVDHPEAAMWHSGAVDKIAPNYGSKFDSNMYLIGLCDECIKKLIKEGKIKFIGNYMNIY